MKTELLESLEDWTDHFKKKQHPVALTLMRAKTVLKEQLAAGGGTVDQASTKLPSAPGGNHCPHCETEFERDCMICGAPNCCPQCCKKTTAESLLRKEVFEILAYWQRASECQCASKSPIGGCLKCDMERLEDRTSELIGLVSCHPSNSENAQMREILETLSRYPVAAGYVDGPCIELSDMNEIREILKSTSQ